MDKKKENISYKLLGLLFLAGGAGMLLIHIVRYFYTGKFVSACEGIFDCFMQYNKFGLIAMNIFLGLYFLRKYRRNQQAYDL
ncbi:hypothetical protein CEQ90_09650 [Lewinellaceae bacterium SD302]|nr:hypothetical protein CEQ90_09650 [Lewinellaceae bacterium SD302]